MGSVQKLLQKTEKGYVSEDSGYLATLNGKKVTKGDFLCKYCLADFKIERSLPKHVFKKHNFEYKQGRPSKEYLAAKDQKEGLNLENSSNLLNQQGS